MVYKTVRARKERRLPLKVLPPLLRAISSSRESSENSERSAEKRRPLEEERDELEEEQLEVFMKRRKVVSLENEIGEDEEGAALWERQPHVSKVEDEEDEDEDEEEEEEEEEGEDEEGEDEDEDSFRSKSDHFEELSSGEDQEEEEEEGEEDDDGDDNEDIVPDLYVKSEGSLSSEAGDSRQNLVDENGLVLIGNDFPSSEANEVVEVECEDPHFMEDEERCDDDSKTLKRMKEPKLEQDSPRAAKKLHGEEVGLQEVAVKTEKKVKSRVRNGIKYAECPGLSYLFDYSRFEQPPDSEWFCPHCNRMPGMDHLLKELKLKSLAESNLNLGLILRDFDGKWELAAAYLKETAIQDVELEYPLSGLYCELHNCGVKGKKCVNCGLYIWDEKLDTHCLFCMNLGDPVIGNFIIFQRGTKTYRFRLPHMQRGSLEVFDVSPNHRAYPGKGVRATKPIAKGSDILVFGGVLRNLEDLHNLNLFCFEVCSEENPGKRVVDALEVGSELRYVNSPIGSTEPENVCALSFEADVTEGEKVYSVLFRALNDIAVGEELLIDYGDAYDWQGKYKPSPRRLIGHARKPTQWEELRYALDLGDEGDEEEEDDGGDYVDGE